MAELGTTATTYEPVLDNLNEASGQLDRLFTNLPAFSRLGHPAIRSLGQASVTGKQAVQAATPTVAALNRSRKPTPELAKNLSIVLPDLDTQRRAVERDPRSPGGKGFSGLQALLGYVFNQALAINTFGPFGHVLAVDAFFSKMCSPYATPATVATGAQDVRPEVPPVLLVARAQPAGRQRDRPDGPERAGARSRRRAAGRARPGGERREADRCRRAAPAAVGARRAATRPKPSATATAPAAGPSSTGASGQAQRLLTYLLAP